VAILLWKRQWNVKCTTRETNARWQKNAFEEFRVSYLSSFHGSDGEQPFVSSCPVDAERLALNELFAACIPRLRRTAHRLTQNREDSEDVLQEALLLGFRKIHQFEHRAKFSTWMHSILRNSARTMWRRRREEPFRSSLVLAESEDGRWPSDEIAVNHDDPEKEYHLRERNDTIYEALEGLPPMYREVVLLLKIEELKLTEVAKKLGVPVGTVKARMHRARRMIKKHVNGTKSSNERSLHAAAPPADRKVAPESQCSGSSVGRTRTRRNRSRRSREITTLSYRRTIRNNFAQNPP
jgi:RNA polymerase sigma-70 factor, ECF subfamily